MKSIDTYIAEAIASLKDFQEATVDHVMKQFFENGNSKILIADEVGLGKTIVSRGVVAKMYQKHLSINGDKKEFTVIYICSNQAIASQNIGKLNFFEGEDAEGIIEYSVEDDRLTALSYEPHEIEGRFRLRIKAFTPATSFDQNTKVGRSDERVLIFRLLLKHRFFKKKRKKTSLKWLLKGDGRMEEKNWDKVIEDAELFEHGHNQIHYHIGRYRKLRTGIRDKFLIKLNGSLPKKQFEEIYEYLGLENQETIINILSRLCKNRIQRNNYWHFGFAYRKLIGFLRLKLSECCKEYLKADLFILDEFQRYNQLLEVNATDNPGVELARQILNNNKSKVLLLSATPFKPFTNDFDEIHGESHFKEFDKVLKFLLKEREDVEWENLKHLRKTFFDFIRHPEKIKDNYFKLIETKGNIESTFQSVIARTERMLVSKEKDAMIKSNIHVLEIKKEDIIDFAFFDKVIQHLNNNHNAKLPIPLEYSKSSPYPFSFLANYQHKKKLEQHFLDDSELQKVVRKHKDAWIDLSLVRSYKPLFNKKNNTIPNPKIRLLIEKTIGDSGANYLWIPPCIPYYEFGDFFIGSKGFTKALIFSSWKMVPRMISSIISYEAERLSIGKFIEEAKDKPANYFEKKRYPFPLLTFKAAKEDESLLSMSNFLLNYPSIFLSSLYDPQQNIFEKKGINQIKIELKKRIKEKLLELDIFSLGKTDGDWQKWSWFSLLLLDSKHEKAPELVDWLDQIQYNEDIATDVEQGNERETKTAKSLYINEIRSLILYDTIPNVSILNKNQFENICEYLATLCLGSPAVCANRALIKLYGEQNSDLLSHSYLIASGFISLFNKPESIAIVQGYKNIKDYNQKVIQYCIAGNLQSMLDEYFYLLKDSKSVGSASKLAEMVASILAIRPSLLEISTIKKLENEESKTRLRTHYALDFGEQKLSSAKANRQINIREAFNSPFRPFVLASTSIGQEGLDFHFYCKKIIHWNLPSNPIDFEQREGRIHRYKGHIIRLNVVEKFLNKLERNVDEKGLIWDNLFELAKTNEKGKADLPCDLIPCWHIEPINDLKIERIVPLYPFSKDIDKYYKMLKILAYYRFTFGQPRQEELIRIMSDFGDASILKELMINLSPISKH